MRSIRFVTARRIRIRMTILPQNPAAALAAANSSSTSARTLPMEAWYARDRPPRSLGSIGWPSLPRHSKAALVPEPC